MLAAIEGVPAAPFEGDSLLGYVWIGLVCTALAYVLWFRGISKVPASVVTFLSLLIALTAFAYQRIGLVAHGMTMWYPGADPRNDLLRVLAPALFMLTGALLGA